MAIPVETFLQTWGFNSNPFATTNAEQERDQLSAYFVRVPWFDRLVGNPKQPESLILFAPRGHGKTSHRLEVARVASQRAEPALVVSFTDFDLLLHDIYEGIDTTDYLPVIRQKTLEALNAQLVQQPDRTQKFSANTAAYSRFCALLYSYMPIQAFERNIQQDSVEGLVRAYQQMPSSLKFWLQELSNLAQAAGFVSVYFLLDGIDEWAETSADQSEVALKLLKPLVDAPGILQECGFAFKFFLPNTLEPLMHEQRVGRLDRIPVYRLEWNEHELLEMLTLRLTMSSLIIETKSRSNVTSFSAFCEVQDVDRLLVQAAKRSPRKLIALGRMIIEAHCRMAPENNPGMLIDADLILSILQPSATNIPAQPALSSVTEPPGTISLPDRSLPHVEQPVDTTASPVPQSHTSASTSEPPKLFFSDRGEIWLGERRVGQGLPKYLYLCLRYLWQNRHRTISYDELETALYRDDVSIAKRADPKNSITKIIRRLRAVLEPGAPGSNTYIMAQPGIGYLLCNFQEDQPHPTSSEYP